jgi:hypothetical protein
VDGNGYGDIVVANMYSNTATVLLNSCGTPCTGDLGGSGDVGIEDLLVVLGAWGACVGCPADLDGDGVVTVSDLLALLSARGPCP